MSKNNQKDYSSKMCNARIERCSVFSESVLMLLRHELCGIPIPQYSKAKVNYEAMEIDRPWYSCRWMCSLVSRAATNSDNGILSTYVRKDMFYRRWGEAFKTVGIKSSHVMHLPRLLRTFYGSMIG